ncbi:hypothetical protein [Chitinophaga barathri]|uniref:Uncharacterized protein n=1 Tax=Chitinophaga barathri TaxID=1647451 RepID=A0A3N4MI32_9BACT|nr:hypothetical protein [Chitinophaga barathri]RPD43095.1 hypothetical protein EG028_02030 [Chitinophaga barathri]
MKHFFFLLLLSFSFQLHAQVIKFQYQGKSVDPSDSVLIEATTKKIVVPLEHQEIKKGRIVITSLPDKDTLTVVSGVGDILVESVTGGTHPFSVPTSLENQVVNFRIRNGNGVTRTFASVVLERLPPPGFKVIKDKMKDLQELSVDFCSACTLSIRHLVYDHSSMLVTKGGKQCIRKPVVGRSYAFVIRGINPFRDSVVVGSETIDFNTEVPALFNQTFIAPATQSENSNLLNILADVLQLQKEIDQLTGLLKDMPECKDVCTYISDFRRETLNYFRKYDSTITDLASFIRYNLQGLTPYHREQVSETLNSYRSLLTLRSYFVYTIPQVQNVDQYIFNFSVLPKSGVQGVRVVDNQPLKVSAIGGIKFDFSTGPFITNLVDDRYLLKPDSSIVPGSTGADSVINRRYQIIQQENEKNLDMGVAAMMHVYPRISSWFSIGATIGAGLSIGPNPSIRYLGGGSLIFGKSGRLILSYGCAAGMVETLANGYSNLQDIASNNLKDITKKTFRTNSFWSLTFNIPIGKSKEKVGEKPKEEEAAAEAPKEDKEK